MGRGGVGGGEQRGRKRERVPGRESNRDFPLGGCPCKSPGPWGRKGFTRGEEGFYFLIREQVRAQDMFCRFPGINHTHARGEGERRGGGERARERERSFIDNQAVTERRERQELS